MDAPAEGSCRVRPTQGITPAKRNTHLLHLRCRRPVIGPLNTSLPPAFRKRCRPHPRSRERHLGCPPQVAGPGTAGPLLMYFSEWGRSEVLSSNWRDRRCSFSAVGRQPRKRRGPVTPSNFPKCGEVFAPAVTHHPQHELDVRRHAKQCLQTTSKQQVSQKDS